jgi:hypothetical protein
MYSNQELADMHFMYGLADGNDVVARCLYQDIQDEDIHMGNVHLVLPTGDDPK